MDSTIQQMAIDTIYSDSVYSGLMFTQTITPIKTNTGMMIYVPVISTIIGGIIVWLGQYIERIRRVKIETRKELLDIYYNCRRVEGLMRNNYRELAMAKLHVEYWWYAYCQEEEGDENEKKRWYDEHLRSQSYARDIERRIGDTKADYIGYVHKFHVIKAIPINIEEKLNVISDLTHPKAKPYGSEESFAYVRGILVSKDEKELRELYYKNLEPFKTINDEMKALIEKTN